MKLTKMMVMFLAAIGQLTTCSSEVSPDHHFTIIEENGIPVAETIGGPKYQGDLFLYEHRLYIHQDESQTESLLGGVNNCYLGPDDQLFIGDRRSNRIVVYGPDGEFIREIGRTGEGPGEFRRVTLLGIIEGMVVVTDNSLRRTSLFQPDGSFVRSIPFPQPAPSESHSFSAFAAYPLQEDWIVSSEQAITRTDEGMVTFGRIVVYQTDGSPIAIVIRDAIPWPGPFHGAPVVREQWRSGIYTTDGVEPIIRHYRFDGEMEKLIRITLEPVPVTAEDREQATAFADAQIADEQRPSIRRAMQELRDSMIFPQEKEFCFDMFIDESGFIWINEPAGVWNMPPWMRRYHIITPDGEYLGTTTPPEVDGIDAQLQVSRGVMIYSYTDPESGEPVVKLFDIVPAVLGLHYP